MQREINKFPEVDPVSPLGSPSRDYRVETETKRSSSSLLFEYSPSDTEDETRKQRKSNGNSFWRDREGEKFDSLRVVDFGKDSSPERYLRQPSHPEWVEKLANSFRSPKQLHTKTVQQEKMHQYPHHSKVPDVENPKETTALLGNTKPARDYVAIASTFLQDYEAGRPPTLSANFKTVSKHQLALYNFKFSQWLFPFLLATATFSFFLACFLEGFVSYPLHRPLMTALNIYGIVIFAIDIWIRHELHNGTDSMAKPLLERHHSIRTSRSEKLVKPLILFLTVLMVENVSRVVVTSCDSIVLFSSIFKPLVIFYVSTRARDALEALGRILSIVTRVLAVEMLLILMFAAVACRLFSSYESFSNLATAWLSLYELATTVVNPSLWMPMYAEHQTSAFFFVFFVITSVFYMHSLVLSVVFQTYVKAAGEIHERSAADKEDLVQMAFLSLQEQSGRKSSVDIELVREVLRHIRPHYNAMKINALVEIMDPGDQRYIDYPTFRTKIRQALNASIRSARVASTLAVGLELVAVILAVLNFLYVIMVSSEFSAIWFDSLQEIFGCIITLIALGELLMRFNPLRIADFTPLTRLNATFDGLALIAAGVSCIGLILYVLRYQYALEFILMGRAIDMIRTMRFFQIFRDVVRRSADVLPALTGPVVLVITTLHLFVYLGMAIWGGSVTVGAHDDELEPLYDHNNFNTYQNGAVTMFQVLVTNDWHAIAKVFTFAGRCSSPYIVYPFFVLGNLAGVSIMLNVLTAFFVESFVTRLNDDMEGSSDNVTLQKDRDFNIQSPAKSLGKKTSARSTVKVKHRDSIDHGADADSEGSSESGMHEFDVFEREGYDNIMRTVAGATHSDEIARTISSYFEVFETLAPGRETVGYLVCDQQTLERFGNRRFQTKTVGFLEENELHVIVSDMHAELLALSSRPSFNQDRSLLRTYTSPSLPTKMLEISAALLRRNPALSLFVTRVRRFDTSRPPTPSIPE